MRHVPTSQPVVSSSWPRVAWPLSAGARRRRGSHAPAATATTTAPLSERTAVQAGEAVRRAPTEEAKQQLASARGLVRWSIDRKIKFAGVRPDVVDGVRGVFSTSAVQPGEALVAVPLGSAISVRPNEQSPFPAFVPQVGQDLGERQHAQLGHTAWSAGCRNLPIHGCVAHPIGSCYVPSGHAVSQPGSAHVT